MIFFPHTAHEIPRSSNGLVASDKVSLNEFWEELDSSAQDDVSGSIGCYIFSIRAGKGCLPWYVGLAERQSFRKECFTHHKINHYNNAIVNRRGTPLLTVISKYSASDKIVSPTGGKHVDIRALETMLIANCLRRNPGLLNVRDTRLLREMVVRGLLNDCQGKPHASVSAFRSLIGAMNGNKVAKVAD